MRKSSLLAALLCMGLHTVSAAKIDRGAALLHASRFLSSHSASRAGIDLSTLTVSDFRDDIFIVNNVKGGWVLVSADDRVPQLILGYSDTGNLNPDRLTPGMKAVVNSFADGIDALERNASVVPVPISRAAASVEPFLGDIMWDQSYPYNAMFPMIGTEQALAGCVTIAEGQIMYYYRYPSRGRGSISYDWNGNTMSADFSQSEYRWDLMKPRYDGSESKESVDAVSKFLYDVALSNESYFGFVTGASLWGYPLVNYFDYDPSVIMITPSRCTRQDYEGIMRDDIDAGHPVYIQAYNDLGGGHAFVCDGYDENGYFHYNMGGDAGYFLTTATGWDRMPTIFCSIKPNEGGSPGLWAGSTKDLYWTGGDNISCAIRGDVTSNILSDMDIALALENKNSGKTQYFIKKTVRQTSFFELDALTFNDNVSDGEYSLYPVCRINANDWMRIYFADNAADHIDLSVKDGVKTYTNTSTGGVIDDGVILIDGIYYRIVGEEAMVTFRNNLYNSYSGDVVIPATVLVDGMAYPVTKIGESAFRESTLSTVYIGENVNTIGYEAFKNARVDKLIYADESNITTLDERAFCFIYIDELKIPSGVKSLPYLTFIGCSKKLDIPASVNYMARWAILNESGLLKDLYVHWTSVDDLPDYDYDESSGYGPLFDSMDRVVLHVPVGCADIYRNDKIWSIFKTIVDDQSGIADIESDSGDIVITAENGTLGFVSLPEGEEACIYNAQGQLVGICRQGEAIAPGRGFYIIRAGKTVRKIII